MPLHKERFLDQWIKGHRYKATQLQLLIFDKDSEHMLWKKTAFLRKNTGKTGFQVVEN